MISAGTRRAVRQRAGYACEYCGVSEAETGGELTIDHYQPQAQGGDDRLDNLLYSCFRCNQYKADYWPVRPGDPILWNPRLGPGSAHMVELIDGTLAPLTDSGAFTVRRMRLNRPPLVSHRRTRREESESQHLIEEYRGVVAVLNQLYEYQLRLLQEQQALLDEQRSLLRFLLGRAGPPAS